MQRNCIEKQYKSLYLLRTRVYDFFSPLRNNPASTRFVAASRAISAAPVVAQITKTTTIKG